MADRKFDPTSENNHVQYFKLLKKIQHGSGRGFEGHVYLIMDKEERVGKIIVRATDCEDGIKVETGLSLDGTMADRDTLADTLYVTCTCEGCGYDMEADNMMTILARLRPWLLERGFEYLSPSDRQFNHYMVNHWKDVFANRGYRIVTAL